KGWFDLRGVVDLMPWPDVRGKRCLDIGTFDGFFAFELERRGAAEVVAVDVEDHLLWDWPPDYRAADLARDPGFSGPPKGAGFRLVAELTGSRVDWRPISIYDLDPDEIDTFDVVVLGSLLLHLRDPIRALEAVRRVTRGQLLSSDQIEASLTLLGRAEPPCRAGPSTWWCWAASSCTCGTRSGPSRRCAASPGASCCRRTRSRRRSRCSDGTSRCSR